MSLHQEVDQTRLRAWERRIRSDAQVLFGTMENKEVWEYVLEKEGGFSATVTDEVLKDMKRAWVKHSMEWITIHLACAENTGKEIVKSYKLYLKRFRQTIKALERKMFEEDFAAILEDLDQPKSEQKEVECSVADENEGSFKKLNIDEFFARVGNKGSLSSVASFANGRPMSVMTAAA